jgi:hypothetical protein
MVGMIKFYASISLLAKIAADGCESAQGESAAILVQVFSIFSRDEGTLNFAKGMR